MPICFECGGRGRDAPLRGLKKGDGRHAHTLFPTNTVKKSDTATAQANIAQLRNLLGHRKK